MFPHSFAGTVVELQALQVLQPATAAAADPRGAQVAGAAPEALRHNQAGPDGRRALGAEPVQPAAAEREAEAELEHHQQEEARTVQVFVVEKVGSMFF